MGEDEVISEETKQQAKELLAQYAEPLVEAISQLFQLSIDQNYAPLQEETLALLSCLAESLSEQFAAHYSTFMPGLKELLRITPLETKAQQDLRANCIQTIGCIFDSVKDQAELCREDASQITQVLADLLNSGKMADSDP